MSIVVPSVGHLTVRPSYGTLSLEPVAVLVLTVLELALVPEPFQRTAVGVRQYADAFELTQVHGTLVYHSCKKRPYKSFNFLLLTALIVVRIVN